MTLFYVGMVQNGSLLTKTPKKTRFL